MKPMINDIVTDTEAPVEFKGRSINSYPSKFASIQKTHYPEVKPLCIKVSMDVVWPAIIRKIEENPSWQATVLDENNRYVEAIVTTSLLRFKDDIAIELRPQGESVEIHMRSRSRLGKSDLGANASRILNFLNSISNLCLLYTSPSPRDRTRSRMPSSA